MKEAFTILIADRNPRVRSFLQREMTRDGYRVQVAENTQDLLKSVCDGGPVHLIILDPDLPDPVSFALFEQLQRCLPATPVVLHTHDPHPLSDRPEAWSECIFVIEKSGNSIERLKQVAATLFESHRDRMTKAG